MTRLIHLTDLHFGLHRTALVEPLIARLNAAQAELIVIGGDLAHRARGAQFQAARALLDRLTAPWIAVPGNHDVPLWNLPARLLTPFAAYRRAISPDLAPMRDVGPLRVIGINSTDPMAWQRGQITPAEIARVTDLIRARPAAIPVIALHHPLIQRPAITKELAQGAPEAVAAFEGAGAQIVLSGHIHIWDTGGMLGEGRPMLHIQGGTGLCDRLSDVQNEFAILDLDGPDLRITREIAPMGAAGFGAPLVQRFSRAGGVWRVV